ncbi:hypothetical protein JCM10449v2_007140 [Rhodotorula kratochvilovae]
MLHIDDERWPHGTRAWFSTMQDNPHLASLVRRVAFKPNSTFLWPELNVVQAPGTSMEDMSDLVVSICPRLEEIDHLVGGLQPWAARSSLFHNLRALSTIELDSWGYSLLSHLPNLQHLTVTAGDADPSDPIDLDPSRPRPSFQLETLVIAYDMGAVIPVLVLSAVLHHSQASLRTLEVLAPPDQYFPPMPSLETAVLVGLSDASFAGLVRTCAALRTVSIVGCDDHRIPRLAYFGNPDCVAALPASLRQIEVPGVPTAGEFDELLAGLEGRGAHLRVLGVEMPFVERGDRERKLEDGHIDQWWQADMRKWAKAVERKRVLGELCAERGITLIEVEEELLPHLRWVVEHTPSAAS